MSSQRGSDWFQKHPLLQSQEIFSSVGSADSSGICLNTHGMVIYLIEGFSLDRNHCKT